MIKLLSIPAGEIHFYFDVPVRVYLPFWMFDLVLVSPEFTAFCIAPIMLDYEFFVRTFGGNAEPVTTCSFESVNALEIQSSVFNLARVILVPHLCGFVRLTV